VGSAATIRSCPPSTPSVNRSAAAIVAALKTVNVRSRNDRTACAANVPPSIAFFSLPLELMKTGISSKIVVHAKRKRPSPRRRRRAARPRRPREQRPVKHFTKEQVERLFAFIPEDNIRDVLLFDLTYRHGLRRGEVALIELADVQGDQIWIARLKGGEGHWHPLHRRSKQLLRAYLAVRPPDRCPYLFRGRQRGRYPLSEETISYLFHRYAMAAGLPSDLRHAHVLRHSIGGLEPGIVASHFTPIVIQGMASGSRSCLPRAPRSLRIVARATCPWMGDECG
jgi:integrase